MKSLDKKKITLKELVYKILLDYPETRNSDKKLIWEILDEEGLVKYDSYNFGAICYDDFIEKASSPESIRRVRQQLQRSDLLLGNNLIQPTKSVKEKRVKLSKEKGASYIMGKESIFNPLTNCYEY